MMTRLTALMMTWRLWRGLDDAAIASPIKIFLLARYGTFSIPFDLRRRVRRFMPVIIVVTGVFVVGSLKFEPAIFLIVTQLPFLLPLVIAFTAPIWFFPVYIFYGAWLSMRIADAISGVKNAGIYDVLAVTPGGAVDLNQSLSSGIIAASSAYTPSFRTFQQVITFGVLVIWTLIFGLAGVTPPGLLDADLLDLAVNMPILALAATIELYAMAVVSTMIALMTTRHAHGRVDARIAAAGLFAFIQIMTYIVVIIGVFIIIPLLRDQFDVSGQAATIVFAALRFAVYLAAREVVVRVLWWRLQQEMEMIPLDINAAARSES